MRSIVDYKLASLYKLTEKHNIDGPFLLRDRKKVSISILFQKVYLSCKLSATIIGGGKGRVWVAIRISRVEKNQKNI